MLPTDNLSVHLVVDADVATDRLLVILQLHFDLASCCDLGTLAQAFLADAVLVLAQQVLHHNGLLLL